MNSRQFYTFISFCIENYKLTEQLTGKEVFTIFKKYQILDNLRDGYEVLHTMGKDYILNDIKELIELRKNKSLSED